MTEVKKQRFHAPLTHLIVEIVTGKSVLKLFKPFPGACLAVKSSNLPQKEIQLHIRPFQKLMGLFLFLKLSPFIQILWMQRDEMKTLFKVARYSFSGSIPPKFEHKLRRHKQSFGKIATTVVLDKDEKLLWSGLQRHRSCHSNEMMLLPILLAAVYLGTGNCSSKIVHRTFFLQ